MYSKNAFTQVKYELILSHEKLKQANDTLKQLQKQKQKAIPNELTSSIRDLELTHKLCEEDIIRHKEEIKKLTTQLQQNEKIIKQLKEENEYLKKIKANKNNDKLNNNLQIKKINQLSQTLGLESKKSSVIEKRNGVGDLSQKKKI